MSVTVSNWKQICQAPTNKSPSKMTYSFPRSQRFTQQKQNKSQIFYDLHHTISTRTTGFGYGSKYDFTKDMPKTPPPTSYDLPNYFASHGKANKGFSFGQGRQEMTITGPLAQMINNKNPGPGAYEPMKKISRIGYSLGGKIKQPQSQAEKVPGPGKYQQNNLFNETGQFLNSKYTNHKAVKFGAGGERFKKLDSPNPGPGKYNTSTIELSKNGRYSLSNLQNSKVRTFGHSVRSSLANRCQTPGPGNYRLPSQFGYYASRKQHRSTKSKTQGPQIQQNK